MSALAVHTTSAAAIARAAALFPRTTFTNAELDSLTDDQIEQLSDEAEAAARKVALDDMRHLLRRMFLRAIEHAHAASTPKLPVTVRFNIADEDEKADRWAYRVFMNPVTVVAYDLLETTGAQDNHLHLLIASAAELEAMRACQLQALATDYAEAQAEALVAAEWQE